MERLQAGLAAAAALPGGRRGVIEAALAALDAGESPVLALVLETAGSTYARSGDAALFGASAGQVGWLSGGCIEPDLALHAQRAARLGRIDWIEIDTRADEDLFSGGSTGCRGRLRIALLPLRHLPGWSQIAVRWQHDAMPLRIEICGDGTIRCRVGDAHASWRLPGVDVEWARGAMWSHAWPPPRSVLVFGAGPETPWLLPLLRMQGWHVVLIEQRARWSALAAHADRWIERAPAQVALAACGATAALVMHHNFELDREALAALAVAPTDFIGLLGPVRRREDLFSTLPAASRNVLASRLHSPVGLPLGGHGAEAIALSIAAQLQRFATSPGNADARDDVLHHKEAGVA